MSPQLEYIIKTAVIILAVGSLIAIIAASAIDSIERWFDK